jgi:hypothetical protein
MVALAQLASVIGGLNDIYRSREWYANKLATKPHERVFLENDTPILISGRTAQILGSEPWNHCGLIEQIFANHRVDSITCPLLPTESAFFCECLNHLNVHQRSQLRLLRVPDSLDDYLQRFSSKHRKNFLRSLKLDAPLVRIEHPGQVHHFIATASRIAKNSWQSEIADYLIKDTPIWRAHLSDLAERGMLRSYLLGDFAYVLGYQYAGWYYYNFIGYDRSCEKLSPGTVLLLRILDDIAGELHWLNFGSGDHEYKRRFATDAIEVAEVAVYRHTPLNYLRVALERTRTSLRDRARACGIGRP